MKIRVPQEGADGRIGLRIGTDSGLKIEKAGSGRRIGDSI